MNGINYPCIGCAIIAALLMQLLGLIELANIPKDRWPDFKSVVYWLPYFVIPFIAAFIVFVEDNPDMTLKGAAAIGVAAPGLLRSLAQIPGALRR